MKKVFLICFLFVSIAFAKENYSEMSTQELIAIIGYVNEKDESAFMKELNFRIPKMSEDEKAQYEKRLQEKDTNENTQEKSLEDEK